MVLQRVQQVGQNRRVSWRRLPWQGGGGHRNNSLGGAKFRYYSDKQAIDNTLWCSPTKQNNNGLSIDCFQMHFFFQLFVLGQIEFSYHIFTIFFFFMYSGTQPGPLGLGTSPPLNLLCLRDYLPCLKMSKSSFGHKKKKK